MPSNSSGPQLYGILDNRHGILYNQGMTSRKQTQPPGPGKAHRKGISLLKLFEMFPDEDAARDWLENLRWPDGQRDCPRCASPRTHVVKSGKPMPFRCSECKKYFSVKTGTTMEASNIPIRKWVIGMYLMVTNLKGVSSMKLHRDLDMTQTSAWFMSQRLREGWNEEDPEVYEGPVEVDETFIGGEPRKGDGKFGRSTDKTAIIGLKDRDTNRVSAEILSDYSGPTLRRFVEKHTEPGATVYSDGNPGYRAVDRPHDWVNHSDFEYVRGEVHTNGIESFWSMLKRGHKGVYHKMSVRHLHRYVNEFAGRHNLREHDTIVQMMILALSLVGKRLKYKDLIADPHARKIDVDMFENRNAWAHHGAMGR